MTERTRRIAVLVGPGALGLAQVVAASGFTTILIVGRTQKRKKLRRYLGLHVLVARPGELPLRSQSVDLVLLAGGLGAAYDQGIGVAQLARVLRPGGALVALTPEPSALHLKLWRAPSELLFRRRPQAFPPEQVAAAFLLAGLGRISQEEFGALFPMIVTIGYATHASSVLGEYFSGTPQQPEEPHVQATAE